MDNFIYKSSTEFKQLSTLKVAIVVLRIAAHLLSGVAYYLVCMEAIGLPNKYHFRFTTDPWKY